jgi:hypothetical protein
LRFEGCEAIVSEDSQIRVPERFIALFIEPGRIKPRLSRTEIETRHELCEDLAQMLTDTAREQAWALGITGDDVLERIRRGLPGCGLEIDPAEQGWVIGRLAELMGWPIEEPTDQESRDGP